MKLKKAPRSGIGRLERLDTLRQSYAQWRDESRAVAESYRRWHFAPGSERGIAFGEYAAALDREEQAACGYRRAVEQARGI